MYTGESRERLAEFKHLADSMTGTDHPWEDDAAEAIRALLKYAAYLRYLLHGHTGYGNPQEWDGYNFG